MEKAAKTRGRPRAYDEAQFLDASIALFSRDGFAGVSVSDITAATDLTAGSIYKAYGDKEGVFAKSLERYIALREAELADKLRDLPDARSKIAGLLTHYVGLSAGPQGRIGCMVVSGVADLDLVGGTADVLRHQLARRKRWLVDLINDGQIDGSVARSVDVDATANMLLALLQGMRIVGKVGMMADDPTPLVASGLRLLG